MNVEEFQAAVRTAIAVAVLVAPVPFLLAVAAGAFLMSRRGRLGSLGTAVVSFTGGLMLGTFLLVEIPPLIRLPIAVVVLAIAFTRWRARRWSQAGWLLAGAALPWTLVYGLIAAVMLSGDIPFDAAQTLGLLAVGVGPLVVGIALITRGDPPPAEPRMDARAGQPGSRDFGSIAHAIREPSFLGPFGLQEIAMLLTFIVVGFTVPLVTRELPSILRILVLASVMAVLGTEAYIRAMTTRSRRAFEAFSWLGEWELARGIAAIGSPPLSREDAIDWLVAHPIGPLLKPSELPVRVEIELLAGRRDEARALLERLPRDTPWERFEKAALADLVEWRAGGDGDLAAMDAAAREIEPPDGDERLRAEVTIAVAKVRRLMADGRAEAGDAAAPLVEVRERLGSRADGQVGRALRRRLIPTVFVAIAVLVTIAEVLGGTL